MHRSPGPVVRVLPAPGGSVVPYRLFQHADFAVMTGQESSGGGTQADSSKVDGLTGRIGPLASLRIRDFRLLLVGTTLTNAAQWIQQVTLSWLVYDMTGSGTMLGSINLVRSAFSMGMIPAAGIMIDRSPRRSLMVAVNGWLFTIALVLGLMLVLGEPHISYLFVYTALAGAATTVNQTLRQVTVFDVVPRALTPNAMALVQTGWALMRSLGPGIGGFLILWYGAGGNFLIQAGAYVLIAVTIVQIQFPDRDTSHAQSSPFQNIREGISYIRTQRVTRAFMMMGFVLPLFIIPIFAVLPPIYAKEVYGGEADVLGMLLASVGFGAIFGGFVTASLGRMEHRGRLQLGSMFMLCMSLIAFSFQSQLETGMAMFALAGFFEIIFLTTNQTLLQLSIPDELRGRVTSVVNLNMALSPLGGLVAGIGSDLFGGPRTITVILAGTAAGITVLVLLFSPTVRDYRLSESMGGVP